MDWIQILGTYLPYKPVYKFTIGVTLSTLGQTLMLKFIIAEGLLS